MPSLSLIAKCPTTMGEALGALSWVAAALIATLVLEGVVALLFRMRRRGLLAVVLVNLLTNPLFNLAIVALLLIFGLEGSYPAVPAVALTLEVAIIFIEWRLLVRVSADAFGSSRRLLAYSAVANAVSGLAPLLLLAALRGA
jgi:hypothetical protein